MTTNKSRRQRAKNLTVAVSLAALVASTLGLTVAFAAVTRNLTINGAAEIQSPSWDVHFATRRSVTTGGAKVTVAKLDDHTITYNVLFTSINQSAAINFSVENSGVVNAEISNISTTGLADYGDKHINYSLVYTDGTTVAVGDTLPANTVRNMRINLDYIATQPEFEADAGSAIGMTVTIQYAQIP